MANPLADCWRLCCPSAGIGMSALGRKRTLKRLHRTDTCSDVIDKTAWLDALADKKNFLVVTN
jgi:hypothetical protein